ncbi:unnamed protein product [Clavelina lepadiformis]|uniref:Secreted protein n=1 Tax=Clavelina lepadiformis TaxID=159417 RepID=A0ABP0EX97_CLALP
MFKIFFLTLIWSDVSTNKIPSPPRVVQPGRIAFFLICTERFMGKMQSVSKNASTRFIAPRQSSLIFAHEDKNFAPGNLQTSCIVAQIHTNPSCKCFFHNIFGLTSSFIFH